MTIVSDFAHFSPENAAHGTAVTVGNFDGCHLGHQWLIGETLRIGGLLGATPVAVTFDPRPEAFFRGGKDLVLFTPEQKTRALGELGIRRQIVQSFDAEFSRVTHDRFYAAFLRETLGARAIVVGDNFRFGHLRRGDADYLRQKSVQDDVTVSVGEAHTHGDSRISSTRIRDTLQQTGDAKALAGMLGRPYMIEGTIRKGDQLGRTLGTPTANLEGVAQLLPRFGIYAGYVALADAPAVTRRPGDAIPAVFSIGIRPTLENPDPPVRIEAHLLAGRFGPDALYGMKAGYYLTDRIRDEAKLAGMDELKAWIARDVEAARRLLGL